MTSFGSTPSAIRATSRVCSARYSRPRLPGYFFTSQKSAQLSAGPDLVAAHRQAARDEIMRTPHLPKPPTPSNSLGSMLRPVDRLEQPLVAAVASLIAVTLTTSHWMFRLHLGADLRSSWLNVLDHLERSLATNGAMATLRCHRRSCRRSTRRCRETLRRQSSRFTISMAPSAMPYRHPRQQVMTIPCLIISKMRKFRIGCQETARKRRMPV